MCSIDGNDSSSVTGASWTRQEDKVFENALVEFPHGVEDRWRRIAELLPSKSEEEVRAHYEVLLYDIADIEAGLVELPCYSDESASVEWDGRPERKISAENSSGSPCGGKRSRYYEVERKKGTPWTEDEHRLFIIGLERYGKGDWRSISRNVVVTRTPTQVASHAQKYFLRHNSSRKERKRSSIHDITTADDSLNVPAPTNFPSLGSFQDSGYPMPK